MSLLTILLNVFLPPVSVAINRGIGLQLVFSIILTIIGWIPGIIHAFWATTRDASPA